MSRIGRGFAGSCAALALVASGVCGSAAAAPTLTLPGTTPAPTRAPATPAPAPAKGKLHVALVGIFHVGRQRVTTTDRAVRVNGTVRPYIRGQLYVVHAFIGHRLIYSRRVRAARSRGGTFGHFSVRFSSSRAGNVFVSVAHSRSAQLERLVGYTAFAALTPSASFGSTGRFVQLIQGRLALLHFYIRQSGVYDNGTGLAVDAYHRLRGWGTSHSLDSATVSGLLDEVGSFHIRDPRAGHHAEGNLSNQLLALANGSHVYQIYPISSGKPSTPTVLGHFRVYSKVPYYLPDGMYFSNFFYGGYAIHGYNPAPDYPASHGCMRVPIPDAVPIYNWLNSGDVVDVYY